MPATPHPAKRRPAVAADQTETSDADGLGAADEAGHEDGERITPDAATVEEASGDPNFMTSLARGLTVIQAFSQQRRSLTISQISQKTGIPRAAVRRCLYTLAQLGFVAAEDGRHFSLRPRILSLGHPYLTSTPLAKAAQPVLRHVSNTLNESSSIAILDGADILYIARASTSRIMTIDLDIGSRLPAHCTSMGRVLLAQLEPVALEAQLARCKLIQYTPNSLITLDALRAELDQVRTQGYALIDQELELGLRSIAVPILESGAESVTQAAAALPSGSQVGLHTRLHAGIASDAAPALAAINVGVHAARVSVTDMQQRILPVLREAARELALLAG